MKQNDSDDIGVGLKPENFANLFNVYEDKDIDNAFAYAINRTLNITGLPNDPNDDYNNSMFIYHNIQRDDTWKLISFQAYGTIDLWWLVCKVNSIIDPSEMPEVGTKIRILDSVYTSDILNTIRNT